LCWTAAGGRVAPRNSACGTLTERKDVGGWWGWVQKERKDELDKFLARTDNKNEWRTVHDDYNDEDIVLSKEEVCAAPPHPRPLPSAPD